MSSLSSLLPINNGQKYVTWSVDTLPLNNSIETIRLSKDENRLKYVLL